jgi:hypothetical protein
MPSLMLIYFCGGCSPPPPRFFQMSRPNFVKKKCICFLSNKIPDNCLRLCSVYFLFLSCSCLSGLRVCTSFPRHQRRWVQVLLCTPPYSAQLVCVIPQGDDKKKITVTPSPTLSLSHGRPDPQPPRFWWRLWIENNG